MATATPRFATLNYQISSTSNTDERFVSVIISDGDGSFAPPLKLPIYANAGTEYDRPTGNLMARDFNGDGKIDLLANAYRPSNFNIERKLYFWQGNGDGTFGGLQVSDPGVAISNMLPGDFNGDNQLDLLVTLAGSTQVGILLGAGNGTFGVYAEFLNNSAAGYCSNNYVADIDGINGPDVVLSNYLQRRLEVYLNDGEGSLSQSALLPSFHPFYPYGPDTTATEEPFPVWVSDFTGDGAADIVYPVRNGGTNGGGLGI
jgi:hypothetical protein